MDNAKDTIVNIGKSSANNPQDKLEAVQLKDPRTPELYSVFSVRQKTLIIFLAAFAASFSPLSSFIYYPSIKILASDLKTSVSNINLTVTSYMIVSGIVPTMWGNLADQVGRRPTFMGMFGIYIIANIALALQRSYPALLVLRMLQSLGSSGTEKDCPA